MSCKHLKFKETPHPAHFLIAQCKSKRKSLGWIRDYNPETSCIPEKCKEFKK
jgi:hypothetical protein